MTTFRGIDVSKWQGENFDFGLAKAEGFNFAILKCGGADKGLYKDTLFETNYLKCKLEHVDVGAYFFGHAKTIGDAITEANFCISLLKGKAFDFPIYYDVEGFMLKDITIKSLTDIISAFCDTLEKAGYICGFYISKSACYDNILYEGLDNYQKWIASWSKTQPVIYGDSNYGLWQYGGETNLIRNNHVAGVLCDQNICFRNYPLLMSSGFNGYEKIEFSNDDIAHQVIEGAWGNGAERRHLLTLAGYDYKKIQYRVNHILKG